MSTFPFLRLPAELRLEVYRKFFPLYWWEMYYDNPFQLRLVCRQIKSEYDESLYALFLALTSACHLTIVLRNPF
jgi:hypothetical protein